MFDKPPVLQNFPKFEAFDLEEDIANGYFLAQLIRENPSHIVCLFLAPAVDELPQREPMIIGQVSANRMGEIVEHYPELDTKYSHAVLCIWKPSISTVHAFVARRLHWCLSGYEEGAKALCALKEIAPFTQIVVTTPSEIFDSEISDGQFLQMHSAIPRLVKHILIRESRPNENEGGMPFYDGWK